MHSQKNAVNEVSTQVKTWNLSDKRRLLVLKCNKNVLIVYENIDW